MKLKNICVAFLSTAILMSAGVASATEVSVEGGVYSPKYDSKVSKNGYYIEGAMSLYEVDKNVSIVGTGGYAKSGKSNGWDATDFYGGVGIKGSYQVRSRTFLTAEVGAAYHIIDIKNNGAKFSTSRGVSPYVKIGADYAISKTSIVGLDYKKTFSKAKATTYGINFKTLF